MRVWTWERLGTLGVGVVGNKVLNTGFDYMLYPFMIWHYGLIWGGLIMAFASITLSYAQILFYDWTRRDWLGIETIKEVREFDGTHILGRIGSWVLSKGEWATFILCCVVWDPFVATTYMRHGAHEYNGMSTRDWKIFFLSGVVANTFWTLTVFTGISVVEWIYLSLKGAFN